MPRCRFRHPFRVDRLTVYAVPCLSWFTACIGNRPNLSQMSPSSQDTQIARGVADHERDQFRVAFSAAKIRSPFVLAVLVIDDDDSLAHPRYRRPPVRRCPTSSSCRLSPSAAAARSMNQRRAQTIAPLTGRRFAARGCDPVTPGGRPLLRPAVPLAASSRSTYFMRSRPPRGVADDAAHRGVRAPASSARWWGSATPRTKPRPAPNRQRCRRR